MLGDLLKSEPLLRTLAEDGGDEVPRKFADVLRELYWSVQDTLQRRTW